MKNLMKNKFEFIAGSLCLDFINTADCWVLTSDGEVFAHEDGLNSYENIATWGLSARIMHEKKIRNLIAFADAHPELAAPVLERALNFRRSTWYLFSAYAAGKEPSADSITQINSEICRLPPLKITSVGKSSRFSGLGLPRPWTAC